MGKVLLGRSWRVVLTLALAAGCGIGSAGAQSDGTLIEDSRDAEPAFAIAPSGEVEGAYFAETMKPGETQTLTVALVNAAETTFHAKTFAADAYTIVNGGMGVREDGSEATGVTTWVDYPAETLNLDPKSTIERSFTVTVPDDAPPGQHLTGIVLQTAEPLPISGSTTLNQILRKTVAVFITVPGPVQPDLIVGEVSLVPGEGWNALAVEVANTGNVLVRPTGSVVLRDGSGAVVLTAPVEMGAIYAGHDTMLEIVIGAPLPPGDLAVDVKLTDEERGLVVAAAGTVSVRAAVDAGSTALLVLGDVAFAAVPSPEAIQYLDVGVRITNSGAPVSNARVILHVQRDGEVVEDFPLASSLALPTGSTEVAQRYVPSGGWAPGAYAFALTLETVDPASGASLVIAEETIEGSISVR